MKNVFTKLAMILIIPALYLVFISAFTKSENKGNESTVLNTTSTDTSMFVNMIMNMDRLNCDSVWVGDHLDKYKELGYNSVQVFPSDNDAYGTFLDNYSLNQIANNNNLIDAVNNKNLKFFYEQVKFSYLCYAQRLVYLVHNPNETTQTNNGFCFQNTVGTLIPENDTTILEIEIQTNPSYTLVCGSIYENLQHSDYFARQYDNNDWTVRPMVKLLDTNNIDNNTPVFTIVYYGFNGDSVGGQTILARNFRLNGSYINGYTDIFYENSNKIPFSVPGRDTINGLNKGRTPNLHAECKVDFKIYTHGQAKFRFKKLTVDDFYANNLFEEREYEDIINDELSNIGNNPNLFSYYMDEVTYSQLPCVKYVMDKIDTFNINHTMNIKFMVSESNWMNSNITRSKSLGHAPMLSYLKPRVLNAFSYELYNYKYAQTSYYPLLPEDAIGEGNIDLRFADSWKTNKNAYNNYIQYFVFGDKNMSFNNTHRQGSFIYQVVLAKTGIISSSPNTILYVTPQIQGEMFIDSLGKFDGIREPLNEEIEAQTMLALSHGADGLINYIFQTKQWRGKQIRDFHILDPIAQGPIDETDFFVFGLFGRLYNTDTIRRTTNLYGQDKWEYIKKLNAKINNWLPTLDKLTWQEGYSVHSEGASHNIISNIKSLYVSNNSGQTECNEDYVLADCNNERYWEEAFFIPNNISDKSKYFLMTNRRCAPEVEDINLGDIRQLKIIFNTSLLSGFNNWKIINVENDSTISTFDKNSQSYVNAGIFQPGEGKLFKLAPVMQEGGTFVCDEAVSPSTFTCNGMVFNNGYDLKISPNTTITFSNNAGIEMNGGSFECGEFSMDDNFVTLNGTDSSKGIVLSNCTSTGIYNTGISNLKNDSSETAVLISNCISTTIKGCVFDAATNGGGISISFTDYIQDTMSLNISECNFLMGSSGCDALSISSNGSPSVAVLLDWCTFTTSNDSSNALRLINVTGGAVKNSTFVNFNTTISALGSVFDMYNNKILGKTNSTGLQCLSGSSVSLGPNSGMYLGGYNYFRNYGTTSSNIRTDDSFFDIDCGNNEFDIDETDYSKHLTGTMIDNGSAYVDAYKNCFHEDSITNIEAIHDVIWSGSNSNVNFLFEPYFCDLTPPQDFVVFDVYGFPDTVYYKSGGEGGGFNPNKTLNIEENIYKSLKDTVNINLRKRNYQTVETSTKMILTQYPDSLESIGMVQKLYMASLNLDSSKIELTKTFLENLISNNTQNPSLIKRAFYFIQKCKVKLGQYQSALEGFQI